MAGVYDAFISYSHEADGRLAPALRTGLERLARPWTRRKALRVFQDVTGLAATPALWSTIEQALEVTRFFVLMASPPAAESDWVRREVNHFAARQPGRLLLVLTDGECTWDGSNRDFDWARTDALPRDLGGVFEEEPLWVDMRWARRESELDLRNPRFRQDIAHLAAPMHGVPPDDLDALDLAEHRRSRRARRVAVAGLTLLTVTSAAGALVAVDQSEEAQAQRDKAVTASRRADAQRLAALSASFATSNTDLALLLALYSERQTPTAEGAQALARAATQPAGNMGTLPDSANGGLALASDRDGDRLAWSTDADEVAVYDVASRRVLTTLAAANPLKGEGNQSFAELSLSADGSLLAATAGWDSLWLADLDADEPTLELALEHGVREASFASTASRLAVLRRDGTLLVYDGGREPVARRVVDGPAITLAWSPTDGAIAVASGHTVVVVDPTDLSTVTSWTLPQGTASARASLDIAFDSTGSRLAVGGIDGTTRVWTVADSELVAELPGHVAQVRRVAWSPDDQTLATAGLDTSVRLWDMGTRKTIGDLRAHAWGVSGLVVSNDGHTMYSSDSVGGVRRWELGTGRPTASYTGHEFAVTAVDYSVDAHLFLTSSTDKTLVWEVDGERPLATLDTAMAFDVALAPGGKEFAVSGATGDLAVHESRTGGLVRSVPVGQGALTAVAYAPDASYVVVGDEDGVVTAVDAVTGELRWRTEGVGGWVRDVEVAPDGSFVAVGGSRRGVRWLAPGDGRELGAWPSRESSQVAIRPDSRQLAIGTGQGDVVLVNPASGEERARFPAHQNAIYELDYSPDGALLATGGFNSGGLFELANFDSGLRLWDPTTGARLAQLTYHDAQVEDVAFSADGEWLISASADRHVSFWAGPAQWPRLACQYAGRDLSEDERTDYLTTPSAAERVCNEDGNQVSGD